MNVLNEQITSRKNQISRIIRLLGEDEREDPWPAIFAYGHTATGKSLVIESVLKTLKIKYVVINCVEIYYNHRLLYEQILNSVSRVEISTDTKRYVNCGNMNDFIHNLQSLLQESKEKLCIVLDKAEKLRNMEGHILPALLRLQEYTGCPLSVVLVSQLAWEKFQSGTGFTDPFVVHFNEYTKDEVLKILASDVTNTSSDYDEDFYVNYVRLVLSVVYHACCNLAELRHISIINFDRYVEPIRINGVKADDVRKLWKNIEPHLRKSLQMIYFRQASCTKYDLNDAASNNENQVSSVSARQNRRKLPDSASSLGYRNILIELPFYSKYLLIASYLASYNPSRTDRRFFVKGRDELKRTKKFMQSHARSTNQLLGPKMFPLDRLLAIFYSIVDEQVAPSASIFSQIASLSTLRLMTPVGVDDNLDIPKYKCAVSLDMIRSIARTVDFDIIKYLYDFI